MSARLASLECSAVQAAIPSLLEGRTTPPSALVEHVERCLACQAELARYRRLLRLLHGLAHEQAELAPGAVAELLVGVSAAAERHAIRSALANRRLAELAGLIVAIVAAGLLALLAARRARPSQAEQAA